MHKYIHFGLDVGSGTAKAVALDTDGCVLFSTYRSNLGTPLRVGQEIMAEFESRFPQEAVVSMTCTGTGGKQIASLLGVDFINEIICHAKAVEWFHPRARTIIDIGGEDAKLIVVRPAGERGLDIDDFALNTACAAGTGAFLEQQAVRLGYDIETFSSLAEKAPNVPTIAGRCTVFAKSDMIHLQQSGVPDDEIIAGLCFAIVRNLKTNIAKGKTIEPPLVFQGGVAANLGVRRAIEETLVATGQDLIIPEHFKVMGAFGAALEGSKKDSLSPYPGRDSLVRALQTDKSPTDRLPPLQAVSGPFPSRDEKAADTRLKRNDSPRRAVLGLDVGSVTTKMVLLDAQAHAAGQLEVVAKSYLSTAGRPLQAISTGLQDLCRQHPLPLEIVAVGSTGSGRFLGSAYVGGDVVRNEISAQASAADWIEPGVDTIFEIGGQDSKYIRLDKGVIVDFAMNKVCAAGTGSFLEEQSHRLSIDVKDFGGVALNSEAPVKMGERCTVFMQSDLVHHQQQGVDKSDLAAGLCYSIVANYLNKVVEQRSVGKKVLFQGGTAFNQGITAAFSRVLEREVNVPVHNEVTGAIGAALLAMRHHRGKSGFLGFDLSWRKARSKYFVCSGCPNACEIQKVSFEGEERPLYFGHRCDRYDYVLSVLRDQKPDPVHKRQSLLDEYSHLSSSPVSNKAKVGLPRCLFFQEWLPFFTTLFSFLGYEVVTSDPTTRKHINMGTECMTTESCLPMKAAHGHVRDLLQKGVENIFLPQIKEIPAWSGSGQKGTICPYVQSLPWMVRAAGDLEQANACFLSPILNLGEEKDARQWKEMAGKLDVSWRAMRRALDKARASQSGFAADLRNLGREVLEGLEEGERCVLLIGRPYNALDPGMNMNISRKLKKLGVRCLPLDCLPLDESLEDGLEDMYWAYGKRILAAARLLDTYPGLIPVFITNFSCGPDAFILHFFERQLGKRPYLELEVDEHTADAGVITRLEAFLDSAAGLPGREIANAPFVQTPKGFNLDRTLYIPPMTDHLHAFAAAFEANGVRTATLPSSDEESLRWGRKYTKGKECLPAVLTTGDIIKAVSGPDFDPEHAAFFMPAANGPCRFGLYHQLHRLILEKVGMGRVPLFSPVQGTRLYQELGMVSRDFTKLAWKGVVAVDLLQKLLLETRPYTRKRGECEEIYNKWLQSITRTVAEEGDLHSLMRRAASEFADLPRPEATRKPVVGIVGEIYVRSNPFANEFLVRRLEDLGMEVWMPPMGEWVHYVTYTSKVNARRNRQLREWMRLQMESMVQERLEQNLLQAGNGWLRSLPEPEVKELLRSAKPYLPPELEGEAVLSIGKSMDYQSKKVQGVINVLPFTCMPGGVVSAIIPKLRRDASIPMLSLSYDGQAETNIQNRLEAFTYQVWQQMGK